MKDEDFNNDAKDAGDMGAGHTVTAFYEVIPVSYTHLRVDYSKINLVSKQWRFIFVSTNEMETPLTLKNRGSIDKK